MENKMRRMITVAVVLAGFALSLGVALAKPDFTGAWTMDRARSFGMPGDMQQTMIVKQTGDQIELETKLIQPNSERVIKDKFILDGKEHDYTPPAPPNAPAGTPAASGKRTGSWLPNGNGIVVNETTTTDTPQGKVTNQLIRKWILSSDGELTIDMYIDGPDRSFETKRIFKRTSG
jgi:hypothetical protein